MSNPVLNRLRPELTRLQAYAVADAAGCIKLDAMENPYVWPPALREQWLTRISRAQINRYPEAGPAVIKQKLKAQFGGADSCEILLGNGSDELIQLLILAVAKPSACLLTVRPSFSMYTIIAQWLGVRCHAMPLTADYQLDINAMLAAIEEHDPALIFLAYPNNPTGNAWPRADIIKILRASKGMVVIDEAYGPFAAHSFSRDLANYPNMLLLRTASKMGLAGIRFGWLAGDQALIDELNKLRLPYNINQLTQITMEFALDHYSVFAKQAEMICRAREKLANQLSALAGVQAYASEANFILFKILSAPADRVFENLLAQKVLIKNVSAQAGLAQCLRVTIGTEEENRQFINALKTSF